MNRVILCIIALLLFVSDLYAQFEYEGVSYKYSSEYGGLEVIKSLSGHYAGDIVIASEVFYGGRKQPVVSIGKKAFKDDSITSVVIPETVENIGYMAFGNCDYLLKVYCKREDPIDISDNPVFGAFTKKLGTLFVSASARERYKHAPSWSAFSNITGNNNTKPYYNIKFSCSRSLTLVINGDSIKVGGVPVDKDFEEGEDITIQIPSLYEGSYIENVFVCRGFMIDGKHVESQQDNLTYTLFDIRDNHNIYVDITPLPRYIYINETDNGSFTIKQEDNVYFRVKVEPNENYEVEEFVISEGALNYYYTNRPDLWTNYNFNIWGETAGTEKTLTVRYKRKEGGK
jgi:hypothetical protein